MASMNFIWRYQPSRSCLWGISVVLSLSLLLSGLTVSSAEQEEVKPCFDVRFIFARGSGQNPSGSMADVPFDPLFNGVEPESYKFFISLRDRIESQYPNVTYDAVTIHNFEGKYSDRGYSAVPIGADSFETINNSVNAEFWWAMGDYRASVDEGVIETTGYIKDQVRECPEQTLLVGGYSQGAQVMGRALFELSEHERSRIAAVSLFGDPEYVGAKFNINDPIHGAIPRPWQRDNMGPLDFGALEKRSPYVPADIEKRVASYCYKNDIICSGIHNMNKHAKAAHALYKDRSMQTAAREMVYWAGSQLSAAETKRGGLTTNPSNPDEVTGDAKKRDVMIAFTDNNNDSTVRTLRYNLDRVLYPFSNGFSDTNFGAAAFGEIDFNTSDGLDTPYAKTLHNPSKHTGYDPAKSHASVSTLQNAVNQAYPFGKGNVGAGDSFYNLQTPLEKLSITTPWREGSEKHIILITNKPAPDTITYDICSQPYRIGLPVTTIKSCQFSSFDPEWWSTNAVPGVCKTIVEALTQATCPTPVNKAGTKQYISRTLNDGIYAAQNKGVKVHTIIPHNVVEHLSLQYMYHGHKLRSKIFTDMQRVAEQTGGKYSYYDLLNSYSTAALTDTIRSTLGYRAIDIEVLAGGVEESLVEQNKPTMVSVATSANDDGLIFAWDLDNDGVWDEQSEVPMLYHRFTSAGDRFIRVGILDGQGKVLAQTTHLITVKPEVQQPLKPPKLSSAAATRFLNGELKLTWSSEGSGEVLIFVGDSAFPLGTVALADGQLVLDNSPEIAQIRLVGFNDDGASEPLSVLVDNEQPSIEEPPEEPGEVLGEETENTTTPSPVKPVDSVKTATGIKPIATTKKPEVKPAVSPEIVTTTSLSARKPEVTNPTNPAVAAAQILKDAGPVPKVAKTEKTHPDNKHLKVALILAGITVAILLIIRVRRKLTF